MLASNGPDDRSRKGRTDPRLARAASGPGAAAPIGPLGPAMGPGASGPGAGAPAGGRGGPGRPGAFRPGSEPPRPDAERRSGRDPRGDAGRPGGKGAPRGRGDQGARGGRSGKGRGGPAGRPRRPKAPPEPVVPIRRALSIAIAGFALLLAFGLVIGSEATQAGFTVVLFGVQAFFVLAWTVASRPPSPLVVAVVGLLTAVACAVAVNVPDEASLRPLGYVIAGSFAAAMVAQLAVRGGRAGVTESLGVTATLIIGVSALGAFAVLSRQPMGDQVLIAALAAVGVGIATARICDVIVPMPRISPQVPRGSTGIVAGAMTGTAAGAVAGLLLDGMTTFQGALAGMAAVVVAVIVDLGTGYAEAGRKLEGDAPFMWLARHMQGPVGAFAFAAPVSYVVGALMR